MDSRNQTYVSLVSQLDCYWGLYVPCHATRVSEVFEEFLDVSNTVYFGDTPFIEPCEISAKIVALPEDNDVERAFHLDDEYSPVATTSTNISGTDGLSFEEFEEGISDVSFPPDSIPYLWKTRTRDVRAKIFIDESDRYVSRQTPEYLQTWSRTDRQLLDVDPFEDPLSIHIRHRRPGKNVSQRSEFAITVWTYTDIWFEDTEVSRRNRDCLSNYLTYLAEELDVAYTEHDSNMYECWLDEFIQSTE